MTTREQQRSIATPQALRLDNGPGGRSLRAEATVAATGATLLADRSGELIQQVQQLLQEPFERLHVDEDGNDSDSDGDSNGDDNGDNDGSDRDGSEAAEFVAEQATSSGEDTPRGTHDLGHTWDFLTNAAQMFDRAPELTEATMADTRKGFDLQGYQWRGYELQRRLYMSYRRQVYPQVRCVEHDVQEVRRQASCIDSTASMYQFRYSVLSDDYRCQINHFQLRDLIWATSNYDVFYYHADGVKRWNPWKRTSEFVLSWRQFPSTFRLSSLCAGNGVVFTGDYKGRYCVKSLWTGDIASGRLSDGCGDDIANHAAPCVTRTGVSQVHVAHNNGFVRQFDLERLAVTAETPFEWAVNCSAMAPDGSLECVVGDSTEGLLVDARASGSGRRAARLTGHKDYSFACSFSPDGRLVATGNQDTTVRVYDVRWPQQSLAVLGGYLGAMRVVRFSDCGRHLLAAEPADYVHVYDAVTLQRAQDIEVMGEISGATFSPDSNCLFMGVSDAIHGNALAEFTSVEGSCNELAEPWV